MTPEEHIKQNFVTEIDERDILFTNKKVFGDDNEHEYHCVCYDGFGYGEAIGWHDPKKRSVVVAYPTVAQLCQYPAKMEAIREFLGLKDGEKITYGDIAIKYGKFGKWFIPVDQLDITEQLSVASKTVDWLTVTAEGNFIDNDSGREISAKTALRGLIEGLAEDEFNTLNDKEKFRFVQLLGSLL